MNYKIKNRALQFIITIVAACSLNSLAQANTQDAGLDYVFEKVCSKMYTDRQKQTCLNKVKNNYYQVSAAEICTAMYTESSQLACLDLISNKKFNKHEVSICKNMYTESSQKSCLIDAGAEYKSDANIKELKAKLLRAEHKLLRVRTLLKDITLDISSYSYQQIKNSLSLAIELSNTEY